MAEDQNNAGGDAVTDVAKAALNKAGEQLKEIFSSPRNIAIATVFTAAVCGGAWFTGGAMAMTPGNFAAPSFIPTA